MTSSEKAKSGWSLERYARLARTPQAKRVIAKHGERFLRDAGKPWSMILAFSCLQRASGRCSREDFSMMVSSTAKAIGIPLADMRIMAKLQLVQTESMLVGSGQMPIVIDGGRQ